MYDKDIAPLSYNNTFKYGYNGEWFNFRSSPDDIWKAEYSPVTRNVGNFRYECIETAKLIRDSTSLPIDITFSGGSDSEAMIHSFMDAGINFNTIIMKFKDDLNAHDIKYAFEWCQKYSITPTIIEFNARKFFEEDAWEYAEKIYCVNPLILPHCWLIDQLDGYVVIGSGDIILAKNTYVSETNPNVSWIERKNMGWDWNDPNWKYDQKWYLREGEAISATHRHFMKDNRHGCPAFYQFNPEIMLAHMIEPEITTLPYSTEVSAWNVKYKIYQRLWNMTPRQKYDGCERLWKDTTYIMRKELEKMYPGSKQYHRTEMNDFISILKGIKPIV